MASIPSKTRESKRFRGRRIDWRWNFQDPTFPHRDIGSDRRFGPIPDLDTESTERRRNGARGVILGVESRETG